jgi:hypothetical protein|uniref:Uncharacterized protein n=1 Tax=Siphoviridae sp. ctnhN1 TaxID=2827589 RepID=A0A8S5LK22_9CAUD|nr:MAG TPA: hypothetical protein [Siphoviridae sp. ctnhN1]DAZ55793.1 MAG TPA: hypothetical protein [Caudoviricetes sp.]DAZ69030.1 MAG TPA: hypothetical protein [Caudoviricetes sp.]
MSLSDGGVQATMPVAPTGMMNSGFGGFGGDGAWWIIILFLFVFCGWGNNGWGGNGNGGGVVDGYVLTSDFANVERKIDSVNDGLCNGFYQQAQLANGTNMAMANGFAQAELSRSNQQAALMQQLNAMQMQAANCCCENRAAIAQVRYDMAAQACDTRNTVQNATRDIIDNANSNSRAILDFLTQSKLADLQSENQGLKLAASQAAQNSYLVSQLRPSPIPAYTVQNPYCCNQFAGCGC